MSFRPVESTTLAQPTMEGAGVKLHRAFGFSNPSQFDPFLLFDDFRNEEREDYYRGFPWHPHRGIETITYVLSGSVDHGDSLGNTGTLSDGDLQWMTAGSGILHQEMPKGNEHGQMHGFQLWANLPSSLKMTAPRYQDITSADLPLLLEDDGTRIKVIIGDFKGKGSPVDGIAAEPQYLDIYVPPNVTKRFPVDTYRRAFAYVFEGAGSFKASSMATGVMVEKSVDGEELKLQDLSGDRTLVQFGTGDEVCVTAGEHGLRFLLISTTVNSPQDPKKSRYESQWHYRPSAAIETSPVFDWPPRPVEVLRWFASRWLVLGENLIIAILAIVTWAYFQPSLERVKTFELAWFFQMYVRNVVLISLCAGGLHLLLYVRQTQANHLKFDTKELVKRSKAFTFNNQCRDNMFWTLTSGVFFWTLYEAIMLWAMANGYAPMLHWSENPLLLGAPVAALAALVQARTRTASPKYQCRPLVWNVDAPC